MKTEPYLYALKYRWLTPLYDSVAALMGDVKLKQQLVKLADIRSGHRVLDVGCGTGTLLALLKSSQPGAHAFGLDGDFAILRIAKRKFAERSQHCDFERGTATGLPFADACFDRVVSSLVFHHMSTEDKRAAFREIHRVLRPGGQMVIADFGPALAASARLVSALLARLERVSDNLQGLLPVFAIEAGFVNTKILGQFNTLFGTLWIFSARKQDSQ